MSIKNIVVYSVSILLVAFISFFSFINYDYALSTNANSTNSSESNSSSSTLSILIVGDIMTDRHIRKEINSYRLATGTVEDSVNNFVTKYLNNLPEINSKYDYVVANLEGPITDNRSKTLNANGTYNPELTFTLPTSTPYILRALNIKVVSLANNHTDNFYRKGYESTKRYLDQLDIKYFGNPYNAGPTPSPTLPQGAKATQDALSMTTCTNNICVAYIGYHQFTKNNNIQVISNEIKRLQDLRSTTTTNDITRPDFIIVMPHWGEEYMATASPSAVRAARSWIDAGADAVIGAHPHVIQNSELYKGKYIYYSLGNYIFDQWKDEKVKTGLGLNIIMSKSSTSTYIDNNIATTTIVKTLSINNSANQKVYISSNGIKYLEK